MRENNQSALDTLKNGGEKNIIDLLNVIAIQTIDEIEGISLKPKFDFRDTAVDFEMRINEIDELKEKLNSYNINVEVIEYLDAIDVTNNTRYLVRISNFDGIYVEFNMITYKNNLKDFNFKAEDYINSHLQCMYGMDVSETFSLACIIAEYLANIIYYRQMYIKVYETVGWDYIDNDKLVFKYDKLYSNDLYLKGRCNASFCDDIRASSDNEADRLGWVASTVEIMNYSKYISMFMATGISGLIRQLLPFTKETNLNMNIVGQRASGKSTIGHYILSIFGNPSKLEGSFSDTTNAMEIERALKPVLPYVLDERMLRTEGKSGDARSKEILNDIFREYEGKIKNRVGSQYNKISGERTSGPIISSSVEKIMDIILQYDDLGQFRRFIEIEIKAEDLFESKEIAERTEDIAYSSYGYGIDIIISYILGLAKYKEEEIESKIEPGKMIRVQRLVSSVEEEIQKQFNTINEMVSKQLDIVAKEKKLKGLGSSSKRFSLILLSYKILREAIIMYSTNYLIINGDNNGNIIARNSDEYFEEVVASDKIFINKEGEILDLLVDNLVEKMSKVNVYEKPKMILVDYIHKYKDAFCTDKEGWENGDDTTYIGKLYEDDENITIRVRRSLDIEKILLSSEIPTPDKIKKYMKYYYDRKSKATNIESASEFAKITQSNEAKVNDYLNTYKFVTLSDNKKDRRQDIFYRDPNNIPDTKSNWGKQRFNEIIIKKKQYEMSLDKMLQVDKKMEASE